VNAAATSSEIPGGIGAASAAGVQTYSAKPPTPTNAITRSPAFRCRTPSPTASTLPATSVPGTKGSGGCSWYFFCTISASEN
jgi:hypothetical protein